MGKPVHAPERPHVAGVVMLAVNPVLHGRVHVVPAAVVAQAALLALATAGALQVHLGRTDHALNRRKGDGELAGLGEMKCKNDKGEWWGE